MFTPPPELVVTETDHWRVNQCVDVGIPGYLIVSALDPDADRLAALSAGAQAELGPLLARVHQAIEAELSPNITYCVRWGHGPGHSVHFHVIPVFLWMEEEMRADARFRVLKELHASPGWDFPVEYDGTEMCLFVRRVYAEQADPPPVPGSSREVVVVRLRERIARIE